MVTKAEILQNKKASPMAFAGLRILTQNSI